jgi:hypothetical protein
VLEVASGTGEHAAHLAAAFPNLQFQPSDPDPTCRASIDAWRAHAALRNLRAAIALDAAGRVWPIETADAVLCINMVHISPWAATEGLFKHAASLLPPGAPLILYGPFRRNGVPTAPSNEAFDADLKARNPLWGLRHLENISAVAGAFESPVIVEVPANNLVVIYRRRRD